MYVTHAAIMDLKGNKLREVVYSTYAMDNVSYWIPKFSWKLHRPPRNSYLYQQQNRGPPICLPFHRYDYPTRIQQVEFAEDYDISDIERLDDSSPMLIIQKYNGFRQGTRNCRLKKCCECDTENDNTPTDRYYRYSSSETSTGYISEGEEEIKTPSDSFNAYNNTTHTTPEFSGSECVHVRHSQRLINKNDFVSSIRNSDRPPLIQRGSGDFNESGMTSKETEKNVISPQLHENLYKYSCDTNMEDPVNCIENFYMTILPSELDNRMITKVNPLMFYVDSSNEGDDNLCSSNDVSINTEEQYSDTKVNENEEFIYSIEEFPHPPDHFFASDTTKTEGDNNPLTDFDEIPNKVFPFLCGTYIPIPVDQEMIKDQSIPTSKNFSDFQCQCRCHSGLVSSSVSGDCSFNPSTISTTDRSDVDKHPLNDFDNNPNKFYPFLHGTYIPFAVNQNMIGRQCHCRHDINLLSSSVYDDCSFTPSSLLIDSESSFDHQNNKRISTKTENTEQWILKSFTSVNEADTRIDRSKLHDCINGCNSPIRNQVISHPVSHQNKSIEVLGKNPPKQANLHPSNNVEITESNLHEMLNLNQLTKQNEYSKCKNQSEKTRFKARDEFVISGWKYYQTTEKPNIDEMDSYTEPAASERTQVESMPEVTDSRLAAIKDMIERASTLSIKENRYTESSIL